MIIIIIRVGTASKALDCINSALHLIGVKVNMLSLHFSTFQVESTGRGKMMFADEMEALGTEYSPPLRWILSTFLYVQIFSSVFTF